MLLLPQGGESIKEKVIPFIPLTFEFMFKKVFTLNPNLLKEFLICVLKLDLVSSETDLVIRNPELVIIEKNSFRKNLNILVIMNTTKKFDVNLNSISFNKFKEKNTLYIEKNIDSIIELNNQLFEFNSYYYLNLNFDKFNEEIGEKCFYLKEKTTNELLTNNFKILYKSLDYYTELYFNKVKAIDKETVWLSMINAKSLSEIYEMADMVMSKKEKNKFIKDIKNASRDKFILSEWETKKNDEFRKNYSKYAYTSTEEMEIIIKKMLKFKISLNNIREITGKSVEEIKEIEYSIGN